MTITINCYGEELFDNLKQHMSWHQTYAETLSRVYGTPMLDNSRIAISEGGVALCDIALWKTDRQTYSGFRISGEEGLACF